MITSPRKMLKMIQSIPMPRMPLNLQPPKAQDNPTRKKEHLGWQSLKRTSLSILTL